jgi:type II secretory ATPase GspE/PulE/Tfp pilus assembly ATPase PilB-like protein
MSEPIIHIINTLFDLIDKSQLISADSSDALFQFVGSKDLKSEWEITAAFELALKNKLITREVYTLASQFLTESSITDSSEKIFSHSEIEAIIASGGNLFKEVPGNALPKTGPEADILYYKYQFFRFIDSKASDFTIETRKKDGMVSRRIMFRIAGRYVLQDTAKFEIKWMEGAEGENSFLLGVQRYIGSQAWINPDLKHVMQDGSLSIYYRNRNYDFRLNAMPARSYQDAYPRYCIRVAEEGDKIRYDGIEMIPFMRTKYTDLIHNHLPGAVLVTGPTGSGKTTTIYAMLNEIDSETLAVLSVEKPIESSLRWVHQTEEDTSERQEKKEAYNLKIAKNGILRQALDVVFIGEMRDAEEVKATIAGIALTGGKVISTLHTNSCVDTILRLMEEWLGPNTIANAVRSITAQRLIEWLCPHCSKEDPNTQRVLEDIQRPYKRAVRNYEKIVKNSFWEKYAPLDFDQILDDVEKYLANLQKSDLIGIMNRLRDTREEMEDKIKKGEVYEILIALSSEFPLFEERKELNKRLEHVNIRVVNPEWCSECNRGYTTRRKPIFEVLSNDKSLKNFIQNPDLRISEIEQFLLDRGHLTLMGYGGLLVLSWEISYLDLAARVE